MLVKRVASQLLQALNFIGEDRVAALLLSFVLFCFVLFCFVFFFFLSFFLFFFFNPFFFVVDIIIYFCIAFVVVFLEASVVNYYLFID